MPDAQERSDQPLRALFIDDNADDRKLAIRDLKQAYPNLQAWEIIDEPSFEGALAECEFDLAITDYQIRWTNGLSVLRAIKDRCPDCPVVMFTGTGDEEVAVEAMKSGLDDYVVKTHHHRVRLVPAVQSALGRASQRRSLQEAEEDRQRLEEELRRRVEELAEQNRRKDLFLAMLAHELRNPLAPILNAVELMRLKWLDDPALVQARDIVDRQVRHMARLIDEMLDMSRMVLGKNELRKETVDLGSAVNHAVEAVRPLMEAKHHELSVVLPREPISLLADPLRLEEILLNLLNNAAKFTPQGGRVVVSAEREGEEAVIRVRDTGVGISPDLLPHIFDLFTQADTSLDRSQGGLGLGLTLVKNLVELHGGNVTASSAGLNQGAEFTVRLPALPPDLLKGRD